MTKIYKYISYLLALILISTILMMVVEYDWYQANYAMQSEIATEEITTVDVFVHSLWWSVATITTVGYGDITPVSGLGKLIAMVCMLAGYGLKLYILIDIFRHYAISSDKD